MSTPVGITDRNLEGVMGNGHRYKVYDSELGLWVDIVAMMDNDVKSGWCKAYSKMLAVYIKAASTAQTDVLAYLLTSRDGQNRILEGHSAIAHKVGTSRQTVGKVFKKLIDAGMMKAVTKEQYMLTPKMIRNGERSKGAMMLQVWGDLS